MVTEQASAGDYDAGGTLVQPFTIVLSPFAATPKVASLADLANPGTAPCGSTRPRTEPDALHRTTLDRSAITTASTRIRFTKASPSNQIVADVNTAFGFAIKAIPDDRLLDNAGL
jgi:hypothetical protein